MVTISEHTFFEENLSNIIVLDLGACEGRFLKGILEKFSFKRYIAIEANPFLYNILKEFESDKINIIHAAVVDSNYPKKVMDFNVDPSSVFNSSGFWKEKEWEQYQVNTITLKDIFERFELKHIDLLKMDIEGAEWAILEEFDEDDYKRIDQITVEFHDFIKPEMQKRTKDIIYKLKKLGYKHKFKGIEYLHNSKYYDSLFYKSDKKETVYQKIKSLFKSSEKYIIGKN